MSDAAATTPAKSPKKKAVKPKKPSDHPKYSEMIKQALTSLKERGGSSRQAILKYIMKSFNVGKDEKVANQHLKMALRAGVKNGSLKQSKGTGASGSFKLGAVKVDKPKKPKAKKAKTPKKEKKPKAKKAKTPKKDKKAKAKKVKKPKADKPKKAKADKPKKAKAAKPKKAKPAKGKKAKSPKKAGKK